MDNFRRIISLLMMLVVMMRCLLHPLLRCCSWACAA